MQHTAEYQRFRRAMGLSDIDPDQQETTVRTMSAEQTEKHRPYGRATGHDLVTESGLRIEKWAVLVNVGQPDEVYVDRRAKTVEIVILEPTRRYDGDPELGEGTLHIVNPRKLLKALDEIEGACECQPGDPRCHERRDQIAVN